MRTLERRGGGLFWDRDLFCGGLADEKQDWGTAMRRTILTVLVSIIVLWGTAVASLGAELPRAQLDESERHFTQAYAYFLERDYWNTLDYLDRALKNSAKNPPSRRYIAV